MVLTPRSVYAPGREPPKAEIIQLFEQIAGGTAAVGDYRGSWDSGTDYVATDIAERNGSLWYAKLGNINVEPEEGSTWTLFLPGATVADGAITNAKVNPAAEIKASKLAFSQDESAPADFPARSVYHRLREKISVIDTGATGEGDAAIDTPAFQEAIDYCQTRSLRQLHIPAHPISQFYAIDQQLQINKPIQLIGEHPLVTVAGIGLNGASGEYMFRVDGTAFPNLEQVAFKNFTIRPYLSSGTRGNGILFDRVTKIVVEDVIIHTPYSGVVITGDRSFRNSFTRMEVRGASANGLVFDSFVGGGIHDFDVCDFNGCATGFRQTGNSLVSNVTLKNTGFEQCDQAIECTGDLESFWLLCCYFEKNKPINGASVNLTPATGKVQFSVGAIGGRYETDNEAYPFRLGGNGGLIGFEIAGIRTEGYSGAMVRVNGSNIAGGQVRSNYLHNMAAVVSNGPITDTTIANNRNSSGAVSA